MFFEEVKNIVNFGIHAVLKFLFLISSFVVFIAAVDLPTSVRERHVEEPAQTNVVQDFSINIEKYNICEMMFGMEKGACAVAEAEKDNPKENPKPEEKVKNQRQDGVGNKSEVDDGDPGAAGAQSCPPPDTSKMGLAPWQDGVLERLGRELTPQEYNMYVVHHGRMLMAFGHIQACTPREKDFVYGSLEPIPVQTVRTFKVMIKAPFIYWCS